MEAAPAQYERGHHRLPVDPAGGGWHAAHAAAIACLVSALPVAVQWPLRLRSLNLLDEGLAL